MHNVSPLPFLKEHDCGILVLGSINANIKDRFMDPAELRPAQLIDVHGAVTPCTFFDAFSTDGISSMALESDTRALFFANSNSLFMRDKDSGQIGEIHPGRFSDIHELEIFDHDLYVANTGKNSISVLGIDTGQLRDISLPELTGRDHDFHVNHASRGADGRLYAVAHHVSGPREVSAFKAAFIKKQGNGGVIDLATGACINLNLRGPHSLTAIGDENWIFDSGAMRTCIFDRSWNQIGSVKVDGWGRGAAMLPGSPPHMLAGLSLIRRRYEGIFSSGQNGNSLAVIDCAKRHVLGMIRIPNVEQINNVYLVDRPLLDILTGA